MKLWDERKDARVYSDLLSAEQPWESCLSITSSQTSMVEKQEVRQKD